MSDRSPDPLPTPEETMPSMTPSVIPLEDECVGKREGSKRNKPTMPPLPPHRRPLAKEKETKVRTRSECISSSSAEHLHDLPDNFTSSRSPPYHCDVLEPQKTGDKGSHPDSPHLYSVVEDPTKPMTLDVIAKTDPPPPHSHPNPLHALLIDTEWSHVLRHAQAIKNLAWVTIYICIPSLLLFW